WRVDKDDLGRAFQRNPADRASRGLNLARNDRDFRSHELVDERRFAGVRRADEGDKTTACSSARAAVHASPFLLPMPSRAMNAAAAACSARRFAKPLASACG